MTSPRKPAAGFWITVALVAVLVGYPLSFGPACWITSRVGIGNPFLIYRPLLSPARRWNKVNTALTCYANLGSARAGYWNLDKYGQFSWWQL